MGYDNKLLNNQKITPIRRELRRQSTKSEDLVWRFIRNSGLGYKFRRQYSIGPFIVDFCCARLKLVVEIDGETHDNETAYNRDIKRNQYLKGKGFVVKRYPAEYVLDYCEGFCDDLKLLCDKLCRMKKPSPQPSP